MKNIISDWDEEYALDNEREEFGENDMGAPNDNKDNDDRAIQELLQEMTSALQEAQVVQERYSAKLDELEKENLFLSDTIKQNKLGLITTERRELLRKVREREEKAESALEEAQSIRSEFEGKINKVSVMIKDVTDKQNGLDDYIEKQAEDKIAQQKKALNSEYDKKKRELRHEYDKMKAGIQRKLKTRTIIMAISLIVAVAAIVSTILFLTKRAEPAIKTDTVYVRSIASEDN